MRLDIWPDGNPRAGSRWEAAATAVAQRAASPCEEANMYILKGFVSLQLLLDRGTARDYFQVFLCFTKFFQDLRGFSKFFLVFPRFQKS